MVAPYLLFNRTQKVYEVLSVKEWDSATRLWGNDPEKFSGVLSEKDKEVSDCEKDLQSHPRNFYIFVI